MLICYVCFYQLCFVGPAGNVWSFGVVLWEILSLGCRPYVTLSDDEVVQQVLQEKRTILNPPTLNYQQGQVSCILVDVVTVILHFLGLRSIQGVLQLKRTHTYVCGIRVRC